MTTYQLEIFKKYLLNRSTATQQITEYIDTCISNDNEAVKHTFHKIMIQNWVDTDVNLFEILSEYYTTTFVPIQYTKQNVITSFYTCSLGFIKQIIKFDFIFPFQKHMYSIDILFNDKTSEDCFNRKITIDDIVAGVVSGKFSEKFELDLSNFCNNSEFLQFNVHFYKISLLTHFKLLMIRMGRDSRSLNLSNNNLRVIPTDILNFFMRGKLTEVNLSNNNIDKISTMKHVTVKIEKLWLEGNPLCDLLDSTTYVKVLLMKFPRLFELDGIRINQRGVLFPFFRNYIIQTSINMGTKMVVDRFLTLYFTHYDTYPRNKIDGFYHPSATFTISTPFTEAEERTSAMTAADYYLVKFTRNAMNAQKRQAMSTADLNMFKTRPAISTLLYTYFPRTVHDPTTFSVDVLLHDQKCLLLVVNGIFKEILTMSPMPDGDGQPAHRVWNFRRTFALSIVSLTNMSSYFINNELFTLSLPTEEQLKNSFQNPIINLNSTALMNPEPKDEQSMCKILQRITQLNTAEVYFRLKNNAWDFKQTMRQFMSDLKDNTITADKFVPHDDFSDNASLCDEID